MLKSAVLILILVLMTPLANADNWGHWRGPTGNGTAINANPPTEWSETKNVKWKVAIPGKAPARQSSGKAKSSSSRQSTPTEASPNLRTSHLNRANGLRVQQGQRPGGGRGGNSGPLPKLQFKLFF